MRKILYFIPVIYFIVWMSPLAFRLTQDLVVTLPVLGYDPVSPLSGHYITYRIKWDDVDCNIFPNGSCPSEICKWGGDECRFYIPEADSKILDHDFRSYCGNKFKCEIEFAYEYKETLIPKKLIMDGKDWKEYLKSVDIQRIEEDIKKN